MGNKVTGCTCNTCIHSDICKHRNEVSKTLDQINEVICVNININDIITASISCKYYSSKCATRDTDASDKNIQRFAYRANEGTAFVR